MVPTIDGGHYTFRDAADAFLAKHESGWKNPKHRQQWHNTLSTYCATLMPMQLGDVGVDDIEAVLDPIWHSKAETASRVMGRIERILDFAIAKKHRPGPNPATWKGNLEHVMPARRVTVRHHPAVPVDGENAPTVFRMLWNKRAKRQGYRALKRSRFS